MVEDGLVLAMVMIMSEQEDFGRLCATVRQGNLAEPCGFLGVPGVYSSCLEWFHRQSAKYRRMQKEMHNICFLRSMSNG